MLFVQSHAVSQTFPLNMADTPNTVFHFHAEQVAHTNELEQKHSFAIIWKKAAEAN